MKVRHGRVPDSPLTTAETLAALDQLEHDGIQLLRISALVTATDGSVMEPLDLIADYPTSLDPTVWRESIADAKEFVMANSRPHVRWELITEVD